MSDPFPCPKCGRSLIPSGELTVLGEVTIPVYQCDECVTEMEALGVRAEVALTFVVRDGRAMNPIDPNEPLQVSN